MTKIGVTGAKGFVGGNFIKYLADNGYEVIAFARQKENSVVIKNCEWRIVDLNQIKSSDFSGVDMLIHFAGAYNAVDAYSKNVSMLDKVLDAAIVAQIKRFYLISTYAVFGNRSAPAGVGTGYAPLEDYSRSKVLAEIEFKKRVSEGKIKGSIIRPCSLYGPGGRNFIDIIVKKILAGEEIQMVQFGNQFLHVDDFSRAMVEIINSPHSFPEYNIEGEIINEKNLSEALEKLGATVNLTPIQGRTYWCEGIKPQMMITVEEYLKKEAQKEGGK